MEVPVLLDRLGRLVVQEQVVVPVRQVLVVQAEAVEVVELVGLQGQVVQVGLQALVALLERPVVVVLVARPVLLVVA